MSGQQRLPALWQRGPAPDETGSPALSQNCRKTTTDTPQLDINTVEDQIM